MKFEIKRYAFDVDLQLLKIDSNEKLIEFVKSQVKELDVNLIEKKVKSLNIKFDVKSDKPKSKFAESKEPSGSDNNGGNKKG